MADFFNKKNIIIFIFDLYFSKNLIILAFLKNNLLNILEYDIGIISKVWNYAKIKIFTI